MNRMKQFAAIILGTLLLSGTLAQAQVGKRAPGSVLDPNLATEAELTALPHFNADIAKALIAKRPFLSQSNLHRFLLEQKITSEQLPAVYGKLFLHINLNTATDEEIGMIPNSGPRVLREFKEYRPFANMTQFRREMGKYWDEKEVARLEQYVFVGINLNTATDEEILAIPGSGPRVLREFKEYRPYTSPEQFRREMGKYWNEKEVARLERYVMIPKPTTAPAARTP